MEDYPPRFTSGEIDPLYPGPDAYAADIFCPCLDLYETCKKLDVCV